MGLFEVSRLSGRVRVDWSFDGDYLVMIVAETRGFRGHAEGHVVKAEFESFAKRVSELATSRQGEASFHAARRGDFELLVKSVDRSGHLGIFGCLRFDSGDGSDERQSLQFALRIESGQIDRAADTLRTVGRRIFAGSGDSGSRCGGRRHRRQ
jgi:hypothetical protein